MVPLKIGFRRLLTNNKWNEWLHLCQRLMSVQLSDEPDKFIWNLTTNGLFTVKSMYKDLMNVHTTFLRKYLWRLKIPLKIKIFMWFLKSKVLLTKDNLAKRNWHGCTKCCFCDSMESVEHLFLSYLFACIVWRMIYFTYNILPPTNITNIFGNWLNGVDRNDKARICIGVLALCWSICNCRNTIVFDKQKATNFLQVIPLAAHWIQSWSLLLLEDQRELMVTRCNRLLTVAHDFYFEATRWRHTSRLRDGLLFVATFILMVDSCLNLS
jgi:hypothetical protein